MCGIHETAIDLHRELCRRGLELNPKIGRDAALHAKLADELGLPETGFSKALRDSQSSAEQYLRALMEVAQPFALMFRQIWVYLSAHCAPKADESILVRFGFGGEKKDIDWDEFRLMVESTEKIWAMGPITLWPVEKLFGMHKILSPHVRRSQSLRYNRGEAVSLPQIHVIHAHDESAQRVRDAIQSWIDAVHLAWPLHDTDQRNVPELEGSLGDESQAERQQNLRQLSYVLTDLVPLWSQILSAWDGIPPDAKDRAAEFFATQIAPELTETIGKAWRSTLEALDILDLPFWRHRWHTYEIWATIKALECLDEYHPQPVITDGRIELDTTQAALVAVLSAQGRCYAHVQAETRLSHPLGRRKAIKPDLRFSTDSPATNAETIAIVEFKQRKVLKVGHVSEVLAAYSLGVGRRGGVVLINYDAAPDVAIPLGCILLGDVHPGRPDKVSEYQKAVQDCFHNALGLAQCRKLFVLLDVSGSMGSAYGVAQAQRGLRQLMNLAGIRVFRFSSGLLPGGDLASDASLKTGGGTELGAALRQLFSLPEGGVPDRLLVVTDGAHDHPDQLLAQVGEWTECVPSELESRLTWLLR